MRRTVSLTKGLNLNLEGGLTSKESVGKACVGRVAVVPDDFPGFVPKLDVKEGDMVSIGSPLLHDKMIRRSDLWLLPQVWSRLSCVERAVRSNEW